MKKVYLIALALIIGGAFSAQAQLKLGVKGGFNFPSLNAQGGAIDLDSKTGWHGGAMVEIKLPILGIEADVLYNSTKFAVPNSEDFSLATLDIPIVAKIYLLKIINIQVGPQFSIPTQVKLGDIDFKNDYEHGNFQFVAGAGVQLGPLDVHGRFVFPSTTKFTDVGTEYKNSNIQLSVGFWLKK